MSLIRTLTAIAVATLSALALTAPTASAQHEPVAVVQEPGDQPCDPCYILAEDTRETTITSHVFGNEIPQFSCNAALEGEIYDGGEGSVLNSEITLIGGAGCFKEPCTGIDWPSHVEEHGPGDLRMSLTFCLQNIGGGGGSTCDLSLDVGDLGEHAYELDSPDRTCANSVPPVFTEVDGHWQTVSAEDHDDMEIVH